MKKNSLFFVVILLVSTLYSFAQNSNVKPGMVGNKISDFTLTTYQGQEFSMQNMRGKNVLLVVSRGKYADDKWCTICHYQYAEYADLALNQNIREKYNLEIVFLFPYSKDTMVNWEKAFPREMEKIEKWKNPGNADSLNQKQKSWMEFTRANYPKNFTGKKVQLALPVLIDDKQEVSKGLDLFRTEWTGAKTMQNIPAIYIIDKEGIIKFKYISQNTTDRPTSAYILNIMDKML